MAAKKVTREELRDRLAASVEVATLGERHQLLDDRTEVLRLGQRGHDLLVHDERAGKVGEHRLPVARVPVQLPAGITMAHGPLQLLTPAPGPASISVV
jgi:hypothetical protein